MPSKARAARAGRPPAVGAPSAQEARHYARGLRRPAPGGAACVCESGSPPPLEPDPGGRPGGGAKSLEATPDRTGGNHGFSSVGGVQSPERGPAWGPAPLSGERQARESPGDRERRGSFRAAGREAPKAITAAPVGYRGRPATRVKRAGRAPRRRRSAERRPGEYGDPREGDAAESRSQAEGTGGGLNRRARAPTRGEIRGRTAECG